MYGLLNAKKRERGFTVVELIIVIVVIAILATVIVVSYNALQVKARNSAWSSALDSWQKILEAHQAATGKYPSTGGFLVCLGRNAPAADGFSAGQCLRAVPVGLSAGESASFMDGLHKSVPKLPDSVLPTIYVYDPAASRGAYMREVVYSFQDAGDRPWLEYYFEGQGEGCLAGDNLEYTYSNDTIRCRRYLG